VAFNAGYSSHEAFTRSFRTQFHLSPSEFRAARQITSEVPVSSGLHYAEGQIPKHFKTVQHPGRKIEVKLLTIQPIRVAFKRHVGPYSDVGATWDKLLPILGKEGLLGGDTQFIGICHDDPEVTPPAKIRYDACVSVPEDFLAEGDIGIQIIAGGLYAVATHFGPYQKLGESYTRLLGQWLPRSGHTLRYVPCFEVYLNDPQSTEPEDLLTDIYAPLES
jgi:AraC family transcriptional regulator